MPTILVFIVAYRGQVLLSKTTTKSTSTCFHGKHFRLFLVFCRLHSFFFLFFESTALPRFRFASKNCILDQYHQTSQIKPFLVCSGYVRFESVSINVFIFLLYRNLSMTEYDFVEFRVKSLHDFIHATSCKHINYSAQVQRGLPSWLNTKSAEYT